MLGRVSGAIFRSVIVAVIIGISFSWLTAESGYGASGGFLLAVSLSILILIEYASEYPSVVEFRYVPPYNRIRFIWLVCVIFFIGSLLSSSASETSGFIILKSLGELLANVLRSDLTHIGLIEYALPTHMAIEKLDVVQSSLALGLVGSLITVFLFYTVTRTSRWPFQDGRFNLWMNLPLLETSSPKHISHSLTRHGYLNIITGLCLLYIMTLVLFFGKSVGVNLLVINDVTLVWTLIAYCFLPLTALMRGIAMLRIVEVIEGQMDQTATKTSESAKVDVTAMG